MSDKKKNFQRIIAGDKKKGKQKEKNETLRKPSEDVEVIGEGSKRRAMTPEYQRARSQELEEIEKTPEEYRKKRKMQEQGERPRTRSSTPVFSHEKNPRFMAWEEQEIVTGN